MRLPGLVDAGFKVVIINRRGHGVFTTLPEKLPGSGAYHWYTGAESRAAAIVTGWPAAEL